LPLPLLLPLLLLPLCPLLLLFARIDCAPELASVAPRGGLLVVLWPQAGVEAASAEGPGAAAVVPAGGV